MGVRMVSHVGLLAKPAGVFLIHNYFPDGNYSVDNLNAIFILEIFLKPRTIDEGFALYSRLRQERGAIELKDRFPVDLSEGKFAALLMNEQLYITALPEVIDNAYVSMKQSLHHTYKFMQNSVGDTIVNATDMSISNPGVLANLVRQVSVTLSNEMETYDFQQFRSAVDRFSWLGFIRAEPGGVDFGSMRRLAASCPDFGWSRGTPVDRYYLDHFISAVRHDVNGDVLEVGGLKTNRETYGFVKAESYLAIDLKLYRHVDRVADVNVPTSFQENSFDSIVAFNVLEHCEFPHAVAENFWRWLKPGGKVFCMVPAVQRFHPAPQDFWRPMPDAMKTIFKRFTLDKFIVYGNALSAIASLTGISAEELTTEELMTPNAYFPVAICLVGIKP
jgi:SAM-dependent methyltransferase